MSQLMTLKPCIGNAPNWPDPMPAHFADPRFDAIWESHQDFPEKGPRRGITDSILRLSIGLEDPADLIADLEQALA